MHFALIQVRVIQFEGRGDDHHRGHRSRSARHGEGSPAPQFNCFPQHITCSFLLLAAGGGRRGLGDLAPSMKCEISADHCSRIQGGSKGRRRKEKDGRDDDRVDELGGQLGWQNMFRDSAKMFLQLRGRRCCSLGSLRRLCHALECCSRTNASKANSRLHHLMSTKLVLLELRARMPLRQRVIGIMLGSESLESSIQKRVSS